MGPIAVPFTPKRMTLNALNGVRPLITCSEWKSAGGGFSAAAAAPSPWPVGPWHVTQVCWKSRAPSCRSGGAVGARSRPAAATTSSTSEAQSALTPAGSWPWATRASIEATRCVKRDGLSSPLAVDMASADRDLCSASSPASCPATAAG